MPHSLRSRIGFGLTAALWLAIVAAGLVLPSRPLAAPGFLCSGGSNTGNECDFDSDCPSGACLAGQSICNGGTEDGGGCETSADCGGGVCTLSVRVCSAGEDRGFACVRDAHCTGGDCITNGLFCFGGDFDRFACVVNADCVPESGVSGTCRGPASPVPETFLCSAGSRDGLTCELDEECPDGACVFAQNVCDGGDFDGFFCQSDTDCSPGAPCTASQRICSASSGAAKAAGCLRSDHCSGGTCVSSGRVCFEGDFEFFSCIDDADCDATAPAGSCDAPGGTVGPTPTFTRRPTPIPTRTPTLPAGAATRTPTLRVPTRTRTPTTPKDPNKGCVFVDDICVRKKNDSGCRAGGDTNQSALLVLAGFYVLLRRRRLRARGCRR